MGNWFHPLDAADSLNAYETAQNSRTSNELLREMVSLEKSKQLGWTIVDSHVEVSWNGEWLLCRISSDAPRLLRTMLRSSGWTIHRDEIASVSNKPPTLVKSGQLTIVTRDGKERALPYDRAKSIDFTQLAKRLSDAVVDVSGQAASGAPPMAQEPARELTPPTAPAGWLPAHGSPGWLQYWDGSVWTDHFHKVDDDQP
ncbi:DUF2510 domain-containing protein [Janibacter anophelis]|uniref:DUF2510 domain-containing protein n=1 Tax=Janibacter anophelis TaxID=319054 RepID=UPI0012EDCF4C|nr:DUF2510 domain-containing protein [Janibacter anophelis]